MRGIFSVGRPQAGARPLDLEGGDGGRLPAPTARVRAVGLLSHPAPTGGKCPRCGPRGRMRYFLERAGDTSPPGTGWAALRADAFSAKMIPAINDLIGRAEGRAAPNSFPVSPRPPVPRPRARSRVQSPRLRFAAIREAAALQGFAKQLGTASPTACRSSLTWTPPQPSGEKRGGQGRASSKSADRKACVLRKPRASTEGPAPRWLTPCPAEGPLPRGRGWGELSGTRGWRGRKRFV